MKRIVSIFICLLLVFSLSACAAQPAKESGSPAFEGDEMQLSGIFADINAEVSQLPMVGDVEIDNDNFESFLFIEPTQDYMALASEGQISSIAHSEVLLRVGESDDAEALAREIFENANPNKWICVTAEKTAVVQHGKTILLVMSFKDTADELVAAFNALYEGDEGLLLEKDNLSD